MASAAVVATAVVAAAAVVSASKRPRPKRPPAGEAKEAENREKRRKIAICILVSLWRKKLLLRKEVALALKRREGKPAVMGGRTSRILNFY